MSDPNSVSERAAALDASDPLSQFRDMFVIDDTDLIYLDGNSLGRLPIDTFALVSGVLNKQWGARLIRSWNEGWWELQLALGDRLAPLVGADPGEVIISDSTSVNLYKLARAAIGARPTRPKVVTDDLNFPTDVYVLDGVARQDRRHLEVVASDGLLGPIEGLKAAIDEDTALVALSHTVFKSGYTYDITQITAMAHEAGALVLWDCSHSVGVVPIDLGAAGADLAVGCTYKYLNGGPGSPAFLYVRKELQQKLENPITAWWGHASPFEFDLTFKPTSGIRKFHTGTMPTLSLAAIAPGLSSVLDAGVDSIREKSVALTSFFIDLWESDLAPLDFELRTPRDPSLRGSHVSLGHEDAWPIARALIEKMNVIPDFRAPDNLRFGFSPLYTSFGEVAESVDRIRQVVSTGLFERFLDQELPVT